MPESIIHMHEVLMEGETVIVSVHCCKVVKWFLFKICANYLIMKVEYLSILEIIWQKDGKLFTLFIMGYYCKTVVSDSLFFYELQLFCTYPISLFHRHKTHGPYTGENWIMYKNYYLVSYKRTMLIFIVGIFSVENITSRILLF